MTGRKVDNILQLVGDTPLVRINRMNPNPRVALYAKLEMLNPGGSVKDRIGLSMIEAAEASGALVPGKIVLEASSGNTAIGLAMVCAVKGYRITVTMAESASLERRKILRAYGAEIILTPGHLSTDGAIEEAYRLAREEPDKYVLADQFNNDDNWKAHYHRTGKEIWDATDGKVDVIVSTMGTTGTLMGVTRYFREQAPQVRVVGVEPFKGHKIQGLKNMKESYPPGIFRPDELDPLANVEDEPAYEAARRLAREEGIFVGMSAGAAMKVAIDEAAAMDSGVVVVLLPDGGERYLSTSLFVSEKLPTPLKFYNTLTRKADTLEPVRPGTVSVYSCGPSLDGPADLGLCRRLVVSDILRRHLEYRGFEVKHAMNLGDIDDRTINECIKKGASLKEFTARWETAFQQDMRELKVLPAHYCPRASEHINDMIQESRTLLEKGLAYQKLGSVYFGINRFDGYGKLSGIDLDAVQTTAATPYDYYEKDNPRDFALFKRSSLSELKAGICWSTPWGRGRPGWHVECSTMATGHLGQPIDIHTASTDLIFPHGDNEIAITEGVTGKPLANIWMHSEVVMAGGRKVTRAGGNDVTLQSLVAKGHSPSAIRYWLLSTHYRTVLNCTDADLEQAARAVRRLNEFAVRLRFAAEGESAPDLDQLLYDARARYHEAMDNDLNTAKALGHLFAFIRTVNRMLNKGMLDAEQVEQIREFLAGVDQVLAVMELDGGKGDPEIERLVAERSKARADENFKLADALRAKLEKMGVQLADDVSATRWQKR